MLSTAPDSDGVMTVTAKGEAECRFPWLSRRDPDRSTSQECLLSATRDPWTRKRRGSRRSDDLPQVLDHARASCRLSSVAWGLGIQPPCCTCSTGKKMEGLLCLRFGAQRRKARDLLPHYHCTLMSVPRCCADYVEESNQEPLVSVGALLTLVVVSGQIPIPNV